MLSLLTVPVLAGGSAAIAAQACTPSSSDCRDDHCVPTAGSTGSTASGAGGGATASSSSATGSGAGAGGSAASCPGEAPGCVNEWIGPNVLGEIGGIAGYKDALYVAANKAVYRIPFGTTTPTPIAGVPGQAGWADGNGDNARFRTIAGVAIDEQKGRLFLIDAGNCALRSVELATPNAVKMVVPNSGSQPMCFNASYADGAAPLATLRNPAGITLDALPSHGYAYFTDVSAVRRVDLSSLSNAVTSTVAGDQFPNASFSQPFGLVAGATTLSVADSGVPRVKLVDLAKSNAVTTLCGSDPGLLDGDCMMARFKAPAELATNPASIPPTLFVSDTANNTIRAIALNDPATVSTVAAGANGHVVGIGAKAGIVAPTWLYVRAGPPSELYIVENGSQIRRMVMP